MVLIVLGGSTGQNNEGRSRLIKGIRIEKK